MDTLRYADRLKEAGLEPRQAEAMSRALNDELTEGLVTRADLDDAVSELRGEIGGLGARVDALEETVDTGFKAVDARFEAMDAKFEAVNTRFDAMDDKFEAKFEAMDSKFEAKFEAMDDKLEAKFEVMDAKFGAMDAKLGALDVKFDAFRSLFRYVFLVLVLIAGLGLYNATAPHLLAALGSDSPTGEPNRARPAGASAVDAREDRESASSGAPPYVPAGFNTPT